MVVKNLCQIVPAPDLPCRDKIVLRNLGNFLLLCLVSILSWYVVPVPCPVSDGGNSLQVTLGPMASSRLSFLVCYGPYLIQFMQVVPVGGLVRHCIIK